MDETTTLIIALGTGAGSIMSVLGLAGFIFKNMLKAHTRDADIAVATRNAEIVGEHKALIALIDQVARSVSDEAEDRVLWQQELDRRLSHAKSNHDHAINGLNEKIEAQKNTLEDTVRRVVKLETVQSHINENLTDIKATMKQQFEEICNTIREMSSRKPS